MKYIFSATGLLAFVLLFASVLSIGVTTDNTANTTNATSQVPSPAAADLVQPAPVDLVTPTDPDVAPADADAAKAADVYGDPMIGEDGECTAEAQAKGECVECLGKGPLVPGTKEAKAERAHSEDCYILRTNMWKQMQQGTNNPDRQSLQSSGSCTGASCLGSQNTNYGPASGPFTVGNLSGGFANPNLGPTLSQLQFQVSNLMSVAAQAGFLGNSSISRALSGASLALDTIIGAYQNYQLNNLNNGMYGRSQPYSTPTYSPNDVSPSVTGDKLAGVDSTTLKVLDYISSRVDHPVVVTSGYRSAGYNQSVGGASQSQHVHGKAIDISLSGLSRDQKVKLVKIILSYPEVNGFGYYDNSNSVHYDTRAVRVGRGYWGNDYSFTSFDSAAVQGRIDAEIVAAVYAWSEGQTVTP